MSMLPKIMGAYPTMVTPYNQAGKVDYGAVRAITQWYWEKGCDGIFAVCQSSEIFDLSLADRVRLTKTVKSTADELAAKDKSRAPMKVVASGHISFDRDEQLTELSAVADEGPDALILISNRMDIANTDDDAWIGDTQWLMDRLPENMPLGVYECPRPYKRLMSDKMLAFCAQSRRFQFMKDTCCDAAVMARRVGILEGTPMRLLNANGQTLLETLQSGAAGYCGVMANFHPELYVWLCRHFHEEPELAQIVQGFLGTAAYTESLAYPVTAKYHLKEQENLPLETVASRTRDERELTDYQKSSIRQMNTLAKHVMELVRV